MLVYFKGDMLRCCNILKGKVLVLRNLRHSIRTCDQYTSLSFLSLIKVSSFSTFYLLCQLL